MHTDTPPVSGSASHPGHAPQGSGFSLVVAAIAAYLDGTGGDRATFDERLAVLGAMNIMRIMGIFARLVTRDNKPRYDQFQPRLRGLLGGVLQHPALAEAKGFVESTAPHLLVAA